MYILKKIQNSIFKIQKFLLSSFLVQAPQSTFQLPPGEAIDYPKLTAFFDKTAKFLYTAGITLGVITLVVSGIMYFRAGSDTEAKKAKGWFKNGIIGTLIILAIGTIIKTIELLVKGGFF